MLYKEAARILKLVESKQGCAKNLTFSSTYKVCISLLVSHVVTSQIYFYAFVTQQCWQTHYVLWLSIRHVRLFVWTDLVTMISRERFKRSC